MLLITVGSFSDLSALKSKFVALASPKWPISLAASALFSHLVLVKI